MATPGSTTEEITARTCCAPANDAALDDSRSQHLAQVFKALGDPARVKLFSLIVASADGEMCVCDLTEPVGLSQSTVSHHMKLLVEAGLVTREQRGRWAYYRTVDGAVEKAARSVLTV
ncbi:MULTISPECIES: metalloregulator ArsR/SmtB family transcription factor [Microbacteriaceae]|uniref:Transcriptional regulator n=1 Tax=Gulosibacter molinativorax TaxID=256821 RepID=A0ABT7CAA0_9MICO|nr:MULTISPECIES: metalloregulator ArsR/SmtB family transcription factor [Microbacteriaceae]MDJ1372127.1 transcriptional regulator [Gulosibacter molinativorax]QUY62328.1 Arsenical resistance operon repressor [Gulosibacter molinativorax]